MICFSLWLKTVQDNFSSRSANSISPQSDVLFSQGQTVCKIFSMVVASSENFNSLQVRFADCQKQLVGHPKLEPNARLPVVDGPMHCLSSGDTCSLPLTADSTPIHHAPLKRQRLATPSAHTWLYSSSSGGLLMSACSPGLLLPLPFPGWFSTLPRMK